MNKLLIGADPEVFVRNGENKVISAHEFPCGSKFAPKKTRHGHVQIDGTALEVNMKPAKSKHDFVKNLKNVIGDLSNIVTKHDPECYLSFTPYWNFGQEALAEIPPMNRMLGCMTDFNAYSKGPNPRPDEDVPIRTAAGHIHLGWGKFDEGEEHFDRCCSLVRELDIYLGLPSLKWDNDKSRRELYGKAGAFRPKPYGLEYRVLSNVWADDDDLAGYVFSRAKQAFLNWQKGDLLHPEYGILAQTCINEGRDNWDEKAPKLAEFLKIGSL